MTNSVSPLGACRFARAPLLVDADAADGWRGLRLSRCRVARCRRCQQVMRCRWFCMMQALLRVCVCAALCLVASPSAALSARRCCAALRRAPLCLTVAARGTAARALREAAMRRRDVMAEGRGGEAGERLRLGSKRGKRSP